MTTVKQTNLDSLKEAECMLFPQSINSNTCSPIFILGAPRSGSTILYQSIINYFGLPFFSNITNFCFPETPIIGLILQKNIQVDVCWDNKFGKTQGPFQPSEASNIMANWFGGGNPSQTVSASIREGREDHFLSTLVAAHKLYNGSPLLIKNAWNCFRIKYLARTIPGAKFIWIRRDIVTAAESDLEARYLTKKSATEWNSATPSNFYALKRFPPAQQVVENQFEFNKAIGKNLSCDAPERTLELWFEEFVSTPNQELKKIASFISGKMNSINKHGINYSKRAHQITNSDAEAIQAYVANNSSRFGMYQYNQE